MKKWVLIMSLVLSALTLTACPDEDKDRNTWYPGAVPPGGCVPGVNCPPGYGHGLIFSGRLQLLVSGDDYQSFLDDMLYCEDFGGWGDFADSCNQWETNPQIAVIFDSLDVNARLTRDQVIIQPLNRYSYQPGPSLPGFSSDFLPANGDTTVEMWTYGPMGTEAYNNDFEFIIEATPEELKSATEFTFLMKRDGRNFGRATVRRY